MGARWGLASLLLVLALLALVSPALAAPLITITPESAPAGRRTPITIRGTGFDADTKYRVEITIEGAGGGIEFTDSFVTDPGGNFSVFLNADPQDRAGRYLVQIKTIGAAPAVVASGSFALTDPAAPAPAAAPAIPTTAPRTGGGAARQPLPVWALVAGLAVAGSAVAWRVRRRRDA